MNIKKKNEDLILNNKKIKKFQKKIKKKIKKFNLLKLNYKKKKKEYNINFNKIKIRLNKEIQNIYKFSLKKIIIGLISNIDSLEQALLLNKKNFENIKNIKYKRKIKYILNKFNYLLKIFNVKKINKINIPFDPSIHEAISMQQSEKFLCNTVIFIMQNGYILNNRLLRPAMVIVSKK
ncbi:nucleotide exchange factor GrpE [Buchnera aphidicola]|uniref:nucleotide exchange factor GrpE n=1 Tax=Buchnera aphidicola TaxID=9 RepID=UPI0031B83FDC